MKKIIKLFLISILLIPFLSLNSFTKAEIASDYGDVTQDEQTYIEAEKKERDTEIEKAVTQDAEVGNAGDNKDPEDSSIKGFKPEDSTEDEESDDDEIDLNNPDSIIKAAESFAEGEIEETLNIEETNKNVNSVYNILLTIGIIISLIWGVVLGIKFIFGSMEGKAEIKKQLIPYIIWVCVIFGSFIIWSVVVNTFQNNI